MNVVCPKCNGTIADVGLDPRGVAEAKCAECGTYIKKLNTREVYEFFTEREAFLVESIKDDGLAVPSEPETVVVDLSETKPICPWCTEYYFTRRGRMGLVNIPVENKYCPVCGRKCKPTDRDY